MSRIPWFVSLAVSAILWLCSPIAVFAREVIWPEYRPSHSESIALDRIGRSFTDDRQPGIASRFANFAKKCLTHDEFTAGHFDPGRAPI